MVVIGPGDAAHIFHTVFGHDQRRGREDRDNPIDRFMDRNFRQGRRERESFRNARADRQSPGRPPVDWERLRGGMSELEYGRQQYQGMLSTAMDANEKVNDQLKQNLGTMGDDEFVRGVQEVVDMAQKYGVQIDAQKEDRSDAVGALEEGVQRMNDEIIKLGEEIENTTTEMLDMFPTDAIHRMSVEMIGRTREEIQNRVRAMSTDRLVDEMFERGMETGQGRGRIDQILNELGVGAPMGQRPEQYQEHLRKLDDNTRTQARQAMSDALGGRVDQDLTQQAQSQQQMFQAQQAQRGAISNMTPEQFASRIGDLRDQGIFSEEQADQALQQGPQQASQGGIGHAMAGYMVGQGMRGGGFGDRVREMWQNRGGGGGARGGGRGGGVAGGGGGGGGRGLPPGAPPGGGGDSGPDGGDPNDPHARARGWRRALGPVSGLIGGLSFMGDIATPGGGPFAQEAAGAMPSLTGGIGGMIGSVGGGPGALVGGLIGQQIGQGIQAAAQPYFSFVEQQRKFESITGEDMGIGPGAFGSSLGPTQTIPGQMTEARLRNPFLSTQEITELTEAITSMGASSEEATELIVPAAEAVDEFRVSAELVGGLSALGQAGYSPMGGAFGPHMASRIQGISQETGMTQPSIEKSVQAGINTGGSTFGFTNAATMGASYASMLGEGTSASDMFYEQLGTAENLQAGAASAVGNYGQMSMLGVGPSEDLNDPKVQARLQQGQINIIKNIGGNFLPDRDENGQALTTGNNIRGATQFMQMHPELGLQDPNEVIKLFNQSSSTPDMGTEAATEEQDAQATAVEDQAAAATGEDMYDASAPEGTFGMLSNVWNRGVRGFGASLASDVPFVGDWLEDTISPDTTDWNLPGSTSARGLWSETGAGSGEGALHKLSTLEDIIPDDIQLESGGTLADAVGPDAEGMEEALNAGDEKIMVGDTAMTVSDFLQGQEQNQFRINAETGLPEPVGDAGDETAAGEGTGTTKVEFTGEAKRFFQVADTKKDGTLSGSVQNAQDDYATNTGQKASHGRPVYGGGSPNG